MAQENSRFRLFSAGSVAILLAAFGSGCEPKVGTDDGDCASSACGSGGQSGGGPSGGASTGGRPSTGGDGNGAQSTGGAAGEGNESEEARGRQACLDRDPEATFWRDEDGCWVCQHAAETEVQTLTFEAEPRCFNYGFQLRRVELGCGLLIAHWSGDAGDRYYTTYQLSESSEGLGGATESGLGPYEGIKIAEGGSSRTGCGYGLYGDPPEPCESWTTICNGF